MIRSRLTLLVIVLLALCLVAVAAACTQQDSPGPESSPTAQAIDAIDAAEAPILYALVDFETYSSIVDLSGVADLVIVGTVDGVAGRDLDYDAR